MRKDWLPRGACGNLVRTSSDAAIVAVTNAAGGITDARTVKRLVRETIAELGAVGATTYRYTISPVKGVDIDDAADKVAALLKQRVGQWQSKAQA